MNENRRSQTSRLQMSIYIICEYVQHSYAYDWVPPRLIHNYTSANKLPMIIETHQFRARCHLPLSLSLSHSLARLLLLTASRRNPILSNTATINGYFQWIINNCFLHLFSIKVHLLDNFSDFINKVQIRKCRIIW